MIVLDRLLVSGIRFVLDKINTAADSEINNPERLRQDLLAAQMQLELEQISEAEFVAIEARLLAEMRQLQEEQGTGAIGVVGKGAAIDIEMAEEAVLVARPEASQPTGRAKTRPRRRQPRRS